MKNIPTKLYLNLGLTPFDSVKDFNSLTVSEITHSFEPIYDTDIEYTLTESIQCKLDLVNYMLYGAESSFNNGEIRSADDIEQKINELMMKCIEYDKAQNKTV